MYRFWALVMALFLAGCTSASQIGNSTSSEPSASEVAAKVTQLYLDIDKSFSQSFASGIDFIIANNYPGAYDPVALQECAVAKQLYLGEEVTAGKPRVDTLTEVPNWIGRESNAADWLLAGETISGKVYEFDLEIDLEIIKSQVVLADNQVFLLYGWCDD